MNEIWLMKFCNGVEVLYKNKNCEMDNFVYIFYISRVLVVLAD